MQYVTLASEGPVSVVTLNRPERLNAIGLELLQDLHEALTAAQQDANTRTIVFTGAGRAFCAGDDLKEFGQQAASSASVIDTCDRIQQITRDIMFGPKLVIGAVHGFAVGGGLEWVLNCDMVVAADDLVAFFPEMALGHFVTGGVTHLLPHSIGHQRAMELIVLGDRLSGSALHQLGLVNRIVPASEVLATAMQLATEVASRSPLATSQLKRVIAGHMSSQLNVALDQERQAAIACFGDSDTARRIAEFTRAKL